jgi:hypothetical protein
MIEHKRPKFKKGDIITTDAFGSWVAEVLDVGSNTYTVFITKNAIGMQTGKTVRDLEIIDFFCTKVISASQIWKDLNET